VTYPKGDPGDQRLTREDLAEAHRAGVDAAEAAQRDHGWTKGPSRDRHPHLVLPTVTFIPTSLEDDQATGGTTITSRISWTPG
jgi:hypothetical protein